MNIEISANTVNLFGFWGKFVVSVIAALATIVWARDSKLKTYVVFNIWSFVFAMTINYLILDRFFNFSFQPKNHTPWRSFSGVNIFLYFIFSDWLFYFYHRFVHTIPLFWTGHFAHHSGSKLHLTLILRENILSQIFTLPFALLGIPLGLQPLGIVAMIRLIIFYQSFLHYEVKDDLPIFNLAFVTPYNHILHHSTVYRGTGHNFGGILNIWDKLGGTYSDEKEYLKEFGVPGKKEENSLWALNIAPLIDLAQDCWRRRSLLPLPRSSFMRRGEHIKWY